MICVAIWNSIMLPNTKSTPNRSIRTREILARFSVYMDLNTEENDFDIDFTDPKQHIIHTLYVGLMKVKMIEKSAERVLEPLLDFRKRGVSYHKRK